MDAISSYLLLGFEGPLFITLGLDAGTALPTTVDPHAFQCGVFDPVAFDTNCPPGAQPSGGIPAREKEAHLRALAKLGDRGPSAEETRRGRVKLGLIEDVIESVAERQAADYRLDEEQKAQELRSEMKARGLEMKTEHLQALNARRGAILTEEIGRRLRAQQLERDNEAIILLLLASI